MYGNFAAVVHLNPSFTEIHKIYFVYRTLTNFVGTQVAGYWHVGESNWIVLPIGKQATGFDTESILDDRESD